MPEVTRFRFRLDADVIGIVSSKQAIDMLGIEVPVTWAGQQVKGTVVEVTATKRGTEITMEIEAEAAPEWLPITGPGAIATAE